MPIETYDPAQHTISFKGNILTGFSPDSLVTVEQDEDTFSFHPSADGGGARARNRNGSCTIRVQLRKGSPSNDVLQAIHTGDKLRGDGVGEFIVKDLGGTTSFVGEAWIQKPATLAVEKEIGTSEWVLRSAQPDVFHVGSSNPL